MTDEGRESCEGDGMALETLFDSRRSSVIFVGDVK